MFEFGRTYTRQDNDEGGFRYDEKERLSLWVTGRDFPESWNRPKGKEGLADMYTMKDAVEALLESIGLNVISDPETAGAGLLAEGVVLRHHNGKEIGRWGMVNPEVTSACDVSEAVFGRISMWPCC